MKKTAKLYQLFTTGVALIIFNTFVMAAGNDVGASCQPPSNTAAILRLNSSDMYNDSTVTQSWICPVIRESYNGSVAAAEIRVVDNHPSQNVTCVFNSLTDVGKSYDSRPVSTSGTPGEISLTWTTTNGSVVRSVPDGYYYIRCSIPGISNALRSGVIGYKVTEYFGVD